MEEGLSTASVAKGNLRLGFTLLRLVGAEGTIQGVARISYFFTMASSDDTFQTEAMAEILESLDATNIMRDARNILQRICCPHYLKPSKAPASC